MRRRPGRHRIGARPLNRDVGVLVGGWAQIGAPGGHFELCDVENQLRIWRRRGDGELSLHQTDHRAGHRRDRQVHIEVGPDRSVGLALAKDGIRVGSKRRMAVSKAYSSSGPTE